MRVHELSKELGVNMKELLGYLNDVGANVRNHMSTVEDEFIDQARQKFSKGQNSAATVANTVAKEEAVTVKTVPAEIKPVAKDEQAKTVAAKPTKPIAPKKVVSKPAAAAKTQAEVKEPQKSAAKPQAERRPAEPRTQTGSEKPFRPAAAKPTAPANRPGSVAPANRTGSNAPANRSGSNAPANRSGQPAKAGTAGNRPKPGADRSGQANFRPAKNTADANRSRNGNRSYGNQDNSNRNSKGSQTFRNNRRPQPNRFAPRKPQGPATNVKSVQLPVSMTVKDFAQLLEIAAGDVIKRLINFGVMATINQEIDFDTMNLIAEEFNVIATEARTEEEKLRVEEIEDDPKNLETRPPVITIMGHVDHGKTSLLDAIRKTNVIDTEAGGITQHIGAYQIELNNRKITFLDTPGHEAFTSMRARGAQATDIAILVVAADDGVMPQTVEALNHAKDANVPIVVAINKIDKPGSNPDRVKQELTEYGLVAEEWGGDTIFVEVSAKQRIGIENLLEMVLLVADVKDLKANPNRSAKGIIIEAQLDKGQGPVATVLVQNGTLQVGDSIIAGSAAGKVRVLINDKGKRVKKAGPAIPVEVIGFDELPEAGDILNVISEEREARQLADRRYQFKRENELQHSQKITLNDLFSKIKEGTLKEVKIIIKADVQGSVQAIRQSLEKLSNDEVKVRVIHGGVGGIGEGDVMLAAAANAIIVGFNVRPDHMAERTAEKEKVDIRLYRVIYTIIDDVTKAMEGMLEPEFQEVINGRAEIRAVYKVPKVGNVAGCQVISGKILRNNEVRLIRDNIVIHEGKIDSLKRFKDDVKEVAEGYECGIGIENYNDIKEKDIIEAFVMEELKRQ